jgi:1-aminocyclopropane-1-carboxylate deaminase/D-cysteine desulfhydrase-like pyridoxal-dependent ACC family enzyme
VAADAIAKGAHTLITSGGVQSNHARVTAAAAAKLGLRAILVANGAAPETPRANALLDRLLGADIRYVSSREQRSAAMEDAAASERAAGRIPYVIPIGASTPLGAMAFVHAIDELLTQIPPPDIIIHSSSSGGTQAGLVAGCALAGVPTCVVGISADESRESLASTVRALIDGVAALTNTAPSRFAGALVDVDDEFVGGGYGVPTKASQEAIELLARTEAIFLDPTYTAKAMAGLVARVRRGGFSSNETVLFWHTGGQVALFA